MASKKNLVDLLAELYETPSKSRRVVDYAGLNSAYIDFKDNAKENWHNILAEAKKHNKVLDLVKIASEEYEVYTEALMILSRHWTLELSTFKTISGSVQALSGQRDVQVAEPGRLKTALMRSIPQFPSKKSLPGEQAEEETDVLIGRDLHWDREWVAETFLGMIKQQKKHPWRVFGLQGREAGLDSLVERFEKMCREAIIPPLLYARVTLSFNDHYSLLLEILETLASCAKNADQEILKEQEKTLSEAWEYIDQSSNKSGPETQSGRQVARYLTDRYLAKVASQCTVALLLEGFDRLRDNSVRVWLRDTWIIPFASKVEGMVILITGEGGLDELKNRQRDNILYHDLPPLPSDKLKEWASNSETYRFTWFTEEAAKKAYELTNGDPQKFVMLLEYTKWILQVGLPLAGSQQESNQ